MDTLIYPKPHPIPKLWAQNTSYTNQIMEAILQLGTWVLQPPLAWDKKYILKFKYLY